MPKRKKNNKLTNDADAYYQNIKYTIKLYNNRDIEIIEGVLQDGNRETFKNCVLVVDHNIVHILNKKEQSVFYMPFMSVIQMICEDMWNNHTNNNKKHKHE